MSRLNELIQELCPDGVEYKTVNDVCKTLSPLVKIKSNDYLLSGLYPVIDQGQDFIGGFTNVNGAFPDDEYIVFGDHTCVVKYVDFSFVQGADGVKVLKPNGKYVIPKFLYYCMDAIQMDAEYARHWSKMRVREVPVPPMEVQREIVRMLDNFMLLRQELSAELSARRKQYEYYRDELLIFGKGVPVLEIGKLGELSAGGDVPKEAFSEERTEEYNIPIISNGIGEKGIYGYTNKPRITKPSVTVAARGAGVGYVTYREYPYYPIIRLVSVVPNDGVNPRYLSYAMERVNFEPTKGGIPQLTVPMISRYCVPVPPIDVQDQIVSVLAKFEELNNSFIDGLPAEIEARTKQYEYYRDKLLSLKRKEVS